MKGVFFKDVTAVAGLADPSHRFLGFGTNFLDYDNDGDLDLYIANGHVLDKIALFQSGVEYMQEHQLFRNDNGGSYTETIFDLGRVVFAQADQPWCRLRRLRRGRGCGYLSQQLRRGNQTGPQRRRQSRKLADGAGL